MSEHLNNVQIERYHQRALAAEELILLDEHAAACASCRGRLEAAAAGDGDKLRSLKDELDREARSGHLDEAALAAYVDGTMDIQARELAENHLAACTRCELLASDLSVFRDEVAADLETEYAPAPVQPVAHAPSVSRMTSDSFYARFKSLFAFNSPAFALGLGTLALLLIAVFIWLVVRGNRGGTATPREVVQTTGTPAPRATASAPDAPTPTPTPPELLALSDGPHRITIDGEGNLKGLDELPPDGREAVKQALDRGQAVDKASLSGLGSRRGALRGGVDVGVPFELVEPVGRVVQSAAPTLRWRKLEGATEYKVAVYDANFNLVQESPALTINSWRVSAALKRGETYSWQVTASKDGMEFKSPAPPAPEAKFRVLDQQRTRELERARRLYGNSHLALGVFYAQAGMLDEAEREFAALVRANPESEVARKLLVNVRSAKRRRR